MSVLLSVLSLILLFADSAFAWWGTGHLIVARVAYDLLHENEPEVLAEAEKALSGLASFITDEKDYPFVECATFADVIKDAGFVDQSHWHYANTPVFADDFTDTDINDEPYNVTWAIQQMVNSLELIKKPEPVPPPTYQDSGVSFLLAKSMNLRLLIHYVGDVHQPLHAATRYTNELPRGDAGGNFFMLTEDQGINELHAVWDSVVYRLSSGDFLQPFNEDQWNNLGEIALDLETRFPEDFFGDDLLDKHSSLWVDESLELTKEYVYKGVEENTLPSEEYRTRGLEIAEQQLAKAGYRLYRLLKNIHYERQEQQSQ